MTKRLFLPAQFPWLRPLDHQSDAPDRARVASRRCWRRAGAARTRRFGGRKRERWGDFLIFSLALRELLENRGQKKRNCRSISPATLGPISGSKTRASAPRRAIRREVLDAGDGTREGSKDAEHDSAGEGELSNKFDSFEAISRANKVLFLFKYLILFFDTPPRATGRLKRTGRWPWHPGCRRCRGPW